jgi:hypothetical protein
VRRYHIESGISISQGFSRLRNAPFSADHLKVREKAASQRRTLGYFVERKFSHRCVLEKVRAFGFVPGEYEKVIVSWGWDADVPAAAERAGVTL